MGKTAVKTLKINCVGAGTITLEELEDLQGDLKVLTPDAEKKLRASIEEEGFIAPIFVWQNATKQYTMNGHQTTKVLRHMAEEGWKIPPLPVAYIKAKSKVEAKKRLLYITSQYGSFRKKGLDAFISDLDFASLVNNIQIPTVDLKNFLKVEPEVPFSEELLESNNYVLLLFDNDIDWLQAKTVLGLLPVRTRNPKFKQMGLGRVLKGAPVIPRLMKK